MADIDNYIERARGLVNKNYDSPSVEVFEADVTNFIKTHFPQYSGVLSGLLWSSGFMDSDAEIQSYHVERMNKIAELLEEIKPPKTIATQTSDKSSVDLSELHPAIFEKCSKLFGEENYSEAVEKGFKVVRARVRELTGHEKASDAFGNTNLHIKGAAETWVDGDFQEAVKFLIMAIDRFRNEKVHVVDGNVKDRQKAKEYLTMSSLAMRLLDEAEMKVTS